MPIEDCQRDGKPGKRYGPSGYCYTYTPGNEESRKQAEHKAYLQGVAIERQRGDEVHE
jgi:hypothetical protein